MAQSSFVVYAEVDLEDNPVDCIYLVKGECRAQPFVDTVTREYYRPTDQEQRDYCRSTINVRTCARLQTYQDHLKAKGFES
jgi:hypothetical protein